VGLALRVNHRNYEARFSYDSVDVAPIGKRRIAITEILDHNGEVVSEGIAVTHPADQFCKAKGRKIAFADAVSQLSDKKGTRRKFWEQYFAKFPPR
jgi:hypothetical protein